MVSDIEEGMMMALKQLEYITKEQRSCFNQMKKQDEENMLQRRMEYIQNNILS